jgi:hypothetical protein
LFHKAEPVPKLLEPIIQELDPWIRITSLRVRDGKVLVTAFNLADAAVTTKIKLGPGISQVSEIKIDGTVKRKVAVSEGRASLQFEPHEIKMCLLG